MLNASKYYQHSFIIGNRFETYFRDSLFLAITILKKSIDSCLLNMIQESYSIFTLPLFKSEHV